MDREIPNRRHSVHKLPETASVLRGTLVVSLLFHAVFLLGLQKAFPVHWLAKPLKTYRVELFRPPVNSSMAGTDAKAELTKAGSPKAGAPEEAAVDTISLDTKDKRYTSYAKTIKARLARHWTYPKKAWEDLIEGDVLVRFRLNRQGHLEGMSVLKPSGYPILDEETRRVIRAAVPFPPFPASVTAQKLNVEANFEYRLTATP